MKKAFRHGEIAFLTIEQLPKGLKQTKTKVIIQGSHGNPHSFDNGKLYLRNEESHTLGYFVAKDTTLFHPDHGSGKGALKKARLPNGVYQILQQHEVTPKGLIPVVD